MSPFFQNLPPEPCGPWTLQLRRWHLQFRYFQRFRKLVNFDEPGSFQEKTQYRKLFGNQPLYALLADKYRVREFVADRVGREVLIPLLGVYDRLTPEDFAPLPDQFIIKANHGCKWHQIVRDKSQLDIAATVRHFNGLLQKRYGRTTGEYHYGLIEPRIVIEQLLDDGGDSPADYTIFCFHNARGFEYGVSISTARAERRAVFDSQWNVLEATCTPEEIERYRAPANSRRMLEIAEALSRGFDFVRVDLYNFDGQIYFGEMTCTPAGGMKAIKDPARAALRNSQWQLDRHNPWLYRQQSAA